ncbi:hypothetical protein Tco_0143663 [Tanacetum coccineum]
MEVHAAPVSKEDINQKFLRSLPPSWSQIALIMKNKPDIDQTDINDLYNNLRVYEDKMKRSSSSTSNSQNLAFLSSENTSNINEVSTVSGNFGVNTPGGTSSTNQVSSTLGADEVVCSLFAQQTTSPPLDNEDLHEISMSVFEVRSSDEEITPANDRFSKADGYHAVPPPITGNFLTPRADISFEGETVGKTNEVNIEKPKSAHESVVPKPKINRDKVIIEDWNSDDEDDVSEVNTVNPVKTNETQTVKTQVDKIGQISQKEGIGFKKIKACFVWWSNQYGIMLKWEENGEGGQKKVQNKLKYPQAKRTFVPSGVLTRTGLVNPVRPNGKRTVHTVSTARPISTVKPISTARPFAPKIAQTGSAIRPIYPRMDNVRPRASYSPIKRSYYTRPTIRPKDLKQDVKTFRDKNITTAGTKAVVNTGKGKIDNALKKSRRVWRPKGNYMDHESKEKGSFILKKFEYVDPKGISKSVIMKITMEAFWLLEVIPKEKNNVLFTDNKCLILSPSFKLLNENQVVFRAPRQNSVYSLDLKSIVPSGGSSEKEKEPTQEYILLPLHPHRPRISVEDVVQAAQEKPSKIFPKDNDVQDSEDVAKKEEQHMLTEADQALQDDLERMIAQEIAAKTIDDATRQAFEEEKKRAAQATSINKGRGDASATSTPTGANTGGSSFVYLGGQIPIDASTLPNADLPIDPNMPDLEDDSNVFPNDGIFSGAYDDEDVGAEADFNNMDNTIDVSPIPTLRVHKDHPKGQILGDPKSAVQTRGKIQKASSVQQALTISQALKDESWVEAMQEELL